MAETGEAKTSGGAPAPPELPDASAGAPTVFISYASQDAAVAGALVEALERHGVGCWIAPRDVDAGALYADAIVRAIGGAKALVLVLSESAIASSHVGKEVERASSKKRPIFALRIDTAPLTPALEYFLSESQWVEAQTGSMETAYAKLIGAIRKSGPTAPGIVPAVTPSAGTSTATPPKSRHNRMLFAAGLAVIAVTLASLLAKFWLAKHIASEQPTTAAMNVVGEKSIAVLPFTDMSEKKDQEYFGDGMAEEIINLLAKVPDLKVIGRTSSFRFKEKTDDLRKIGTTLGAAYVVEGSVRRSGNHVRVTAQLIDTRDGAHRWSETYDRDTSDVLKVQDEIAASLVRALQLEVAPAIYLQSSSPRNSEAYDFYLRGLHASNRFDQRGFEEAVADFRHALELDPSLVSAAEGLAKTLERMTDWGYLVPKTGWEQARVAAEAALKLDSKSALAHAILGNVYTKYDWDWPAAARELKTAVALAPNDPTVLACAAMERLAVGQWDEGLRFLNSASTADPLDPDIHHVTGWFYVRLRRFADAESEYRRALEISPTYAWGHYFLGIALLTDGKAEAALDEMEKEAEVDAKVAGLAIVYQALHRTKDADAALARLEAEYAGQDAKQITDYYAFRGQKDQAFKWLDRAYAQKDNGLYYIKGDPLMKNLEADPRYKAFLRKMNLPE
jgi:TolB-like protein